MIKIENDVVNELFILQNIKIEDIIIYFDLIGYNKFMVFFVLFISIVFIVIKIENDVVVIELIDKDVIFDVRLIGWNEFEVNTFYFVNL